MQRELDTLWEENKRLLNPQTFILNLSPALQKVKEDLLTEYSANKQNNIKTYDLDEISENDL